MVGHFVYKGSAPVLIVTKLSDFELLERHAEVSPSTDAPWDSEASMICRRLKVHEFTVQGPMQTQNFKFCGRCFSRYAMERVAA